MKNYSLIALIAFFGISLGVQAQFDDLYYNPDAAESYDYDDSDIDYDNANYDDATYDDDTYADYDYWSEYEDNYYTNRINRNRRVNVRPVWLNSWAANSFFYNPYDFYNPYNTAFVGGPFVSINIGNPYAYNRFNNNFYGPSFFYGRNFNRFNRFNSFNTGFGFNRFNRGFAGGGFGGGFGGGGYNPYCPVGGNTFSQTRAAVVNLPSPKGVYNGSRRTGSTYGSNGSTSSPRTNNQTVRSNRSSNTLKNSTGTTRDFSTTRSTVRSNRATTNRANSRATTRPSNRTTTRSTRSTINNRATRNNNSRINSRSNYPSTSRRSSTRSSSRSSSPRVSSSRSIRSSRGGR